MDHSFIRGAAAALLVVATAPLAGAGAGAQSAGAVQVRPSRDTLSVRILGTDKAKVDSMMVIMRAIEAEPALSEQSIRLRREFEAVYRALAMGRGLGGPGTVFLRADGLMEPRPLKGWIGINTGLVPLQRFIDSTGYFVHYFRYPPIVSVEPDSPAQRAGIVQGDVLVAYDGQDVVRSRVNMDALLVPERKLGVTVRREGENREFSLVVAKTPERITIRRLEPASEMPVPPYPGERGGRKSFGRGDRAGDGAIVRAMPARGPSSDRPVTIEVSPDGYSLNRVTLMNPGGVFGARLITVSPELARATKLERGVLIQECGDETPAFKAGLRTGDYIVSIAGQQVSTVGELQSIVWSRLSERAVALKVLRERKPVAVTVKW